MTPHDLKQYGQQSERMPASLRAVCKVLVGVIVIGTAYGMVADEADRVVVMSRATFEQTIAAERIKAATEMAEAVTPGTCGWRDQFDERRQPKRGAM